MPRSQKLKRTVATSLLAAFILQASGCGTLIYPERRGQTSGQIDPAVAILDGVGVIVFIIPGLIAFAVDFATGAIYLPPNRSGKQSSISGDLHVVQADPDALTTGNVNEIIARETGYTDVLARDDLRAERVADISGLSKSINAAGQ